MGESFIDNNSRKRVRDDSFESHSAESKRIRDDSEVNSSDWKRVDSEASELNSYEAEKIRDDILDILDDSDTVTGPDPEIQDLDSVIKSFEEEILHPAPALDSGELGYLLEASDDELGLPPLISSAGEQSKNEVTDLVNIPSNAFGIGEMAGFENEIPSYDSFGFGFGFSFGEETGGNNDGDIGEFVTFGGLFDYTEASEFSEFSWWPESLPAQ